MEIIRQSVQRLFRNPHAVFFRYQSRDNNQRCIRPSEIDVLSPVFQRGQSGLEGVYPFEIGPISYASHPGILNNKI